MAEYIKRKLGAIRPLGWAMILIIGVLCSGILLVRASEVDRGYAKYI